MRRLLDSAKSMALAVTALALAIQPFVGAIANATGDVLLATGVPPSPAVASGPATPYDSMVAEAATAGKAEQKTNLPQFGSSLRAALRRRLFNTGTDPSDPVNQLSIRNYYFNYKHGEFRDNVILRIEEKAHAGLELAAELPFSTAYRRGRHYYGSGDSYVETLYTPWKNSRYGLTMGAGMVIPTGSSSMLGSGKWQLAPILTPLFYPLGDERLLAYLELRDFISVASVGQFNFVSAAGDAPFSESAGSQINYLEIRPVIRYTFADQWYLYSEPFFTVVDWEKGNRLSYRSALRLGHMFNPRVGAWIQPEIPFGSDRTGTFNLKVSLFFRY